MYMDHESLKIEEKEKRIIGTVNIFDADLKGHQEDHQLLVVLNRPIQEVVELVLVQVERNHLEEGEKEEVDFHSHYHHLKNKIE
jgi:hypothetical protein